MGRDLSLLLPELVLAGAAMLMIVAEMARAARVALGVALAALAISALLTLQVLQADTTVFGGTYRIAMISGWAKLILLPGTALSLLMTRAEIAGREREGSVYALIVLVTLGALMLSGGGDLMLLVLGVVLTGLGSFALVAWPRDDAATEAAMKYLIFGAVTGAVMIYGLSFWFGGTGSTLYSALERLNGPVIAMAGLVAVIVGLGYKAALVPFHFWTPDVYEGAPTPITAFLSVAPKAAGFAILIRVFYTMFTLDGSVTATLPLTNINWPALIAVASAITMTLGNLLAVQQEDVKRLLAYSTISHVGFMLMAFAIISPDAVRAIMLYLFIYLFMNLAAFYMAIFASNKLNAHHINDWDGLSRKNPVLCAFMALTLISLTGLPPTAGFVGKFYIFAELFKHQQFYWLAVVAILNSVVSLYYYFKIVKSMYLVDVEGEVNKIEAHPVVNWSIILFSAQNILFFIYWEPLIGFIEKSINLWKG